MNHTTATRCRLERLSKNPHSLENIAALTGELDAALAEIPKPLQIYLDALLAFVREKSHEMTVANMRLVGKVIGVYFFPTLSSKKISLDDATQEGAIALMHAAMLYDHALGFKFSTYAVQWIMQYIRRMVQKNNLIAIPAHYMNKSQYKKVVKTREKYQEQVTRAQRIIQLSGIRHFAHESGEVGSPGESLITDDRNPESVEKLDARIDIEDLLRCLPDKEREVIRCRFFEGWGLKETARRLVDLGYPLWSKERIRQLEVMALIRMKRRAESLKAKAARED